MSVSSFANEMLRHDTNKGIIFFLFIHKMYQHVCLLPQAV